MGRHRRRRCGHVHGGGRGGRRRAPRLRTLSGHGHHRLRSHRGGRAHRVGLGDGRTWRHLQHPQARAAHALLDGDAGGGARPLAHRQSAPLRMGACLSRRQEQRGGRGIAGALRLLRADRRLHRFRRLRGRCGRALHVFERLHLAGQLHPPDLDSVPPRVALRRSRAHRGARGGQRGADHPARAPDPAPRLPPHPLRVAAPALDLLAA